MERSIAKNAVFNVIHRVFSVMFPLVTSMYVSRVLGAAGVGEVSSAQNLVTYFTMIASLGIPTYGVKAIAETKNQKEKRDKTFSELFIINFVSTIFSYITYILLLIQINGGVTIDSLQLIFSSLILINIFNVEWVYQGFEEYKYITIRSLFVKLLSLVLMLVFVRDEKSGFSYAIILCIGTVGNYFMNMFNLRRHVRFSFKNLEIKKHLRFIITFFASIVAIEIYSLADVTMLTYMTNSSVVGCYSNATKISKLAASMVTAIGTVLLPRLSLHFKEIDYGVIKKTIGDFFNVVVMISIPACIGMIIAANEIVLALFGSDFVLAIPTLQILSCLAFLMPLSGGVFGQVLLASGKEKAYFIGVFSGTITNIIFNAVFIGGLQQNGAAIASVVTELIITVVMYVACQKIVKAKYFSRDVVSVIISCLMMAVAVIGTKLILKEMSVVVILIAELTVGVLCYGIGLYITRNSIFRAVINKVMRKN